ncbi:mannose-1-phosphate guanylyltransferase/mannose-6-phosphate isomerase [Ensifer adhaerens]|nr:mannose-1-phosphate guanylyltransferase/mannose-6-phosphate isomerase [Ensifer adhaerens]
MLRVFRQYIGCGLHTAVDINSRKQSGIARGGTDTVSDKRRSLVGGPRGTPVIIPIGGDAGPKANSAHCEPKASITVFVPRSRSRKYTLLRKSPLTQVVSKITPVLLAGGAGSRLWPVSRDQLPKQFQPLVGEYSTYQQTLKRISDPSLYRRPLVITNDQFRFFAQRQADDAGVPAEVVLEPARRDSAAAIAAAALLAEHRAPGGLVLALAADHIVLDDSSFTDAVRLGCKAAMEGHIVVFGLTPTEPRTAYGYINPGATFDGHTDLRMVQAFVEKPSLETALGYMQNGYLWNSGNFLFRSDAMIAEFEAHAPEILAAVRGAVQYAGSDLGFVRLDKERFECAPKNSIDYAVIEKTRKIAVVRGHFGWSDIGSWDAIWEVAPKDSAENVIQGDGFALKSEGCLIHSSGLITTVVGAKDLVIVATKDAVLVVPKSQSQEVKGLVETLKGVGQNEVTEMHARMHSPWGYIEEMFTGDRFGVKRIMIEPGARTSLQRHMNRSEHWVVVRGTATVTIDDRTNILAEDESVYVPVGRVHRIANEGKVPLELIEIRTGTYIDETDIVRLEDDYMRALSPYPASAG